MLSGALTSFLTEVTEPLEFAFMFVAWPLFLIHVPHRHRPGPRQRAGDQGRLRVLGGVHRLHLNFTAATSPLLLIPVGLGYAVVYYVVFRAVIGASTCAPRAVSARTWRTRGPRRGRLVRWATDLRRPPAS